MPAGLKRLLIVILATLTAASATAQSPTDAVNEQGLVTIGGIPQWVSVRGRHRSKPLLLVLHGGPGFTLSPVSYHYMRDWEEHFTVVQWDQRGAGKTYAANDPKKIEATLSIDRMVADAQGLIGYLREKYQQDRIVLMGHSFGSLLGVKLAQRKPEWLHAYVGMGQVTDFERSEAEGYAATLAAAKADKNEKAVAALLAIAPFPDKKNPARNLENLGTERFWLATYGGYYRAGGFGHHEEISRSSPDYSAAELKTRDEAQGFSLKALWNEVSHISLMKATQFKVPVVILQGRHDRGTSSTLVDEWFATIEAPVKKLVWFEDSAHMVYEEEPGKTLVSLVNEVLPLVKEEGKR